MLRVLLTSRSASRYAALVSLLGGLGYLMRRDAIVINLTAAYPPAHLPYVELCAVTAAALGVVLLRPRFWEWDRTATRRAAWAAGVAATAGILGPALMVAVAGLDRPPETAWSWLVANVLVLGALAFVAAPFLGPGLAGALVLVLYFGVGVLTNLAPGIAASVPISAYPGPDGHWPVAAALGALAVVVNFSTRGSTAWARRTFAND